MRPQLERELRPWPKLIIERRPAFDDDRSEDFAIAGYDPHPFIRLPLAD